MAVDPATAKAIVMVLKKIAEDERLGRCVFIAIMIPILVILLVLASPFAIIFGVAGETNDEGGIPITDIMAELTAELSENIQAHTQGEYDEVNIIYMGSEGEAINNSGTVLALFAVDSSMIEDSQTNPMPVANLSEKQVEKLESLYWKMNSVSSEVVTLTCGDEGYPDELWDEVADATEDEPQPTPRPFCIKNVYVTCLGYEDMLDELNFSDSQLKVLNDMMHGDFAYLFASVSGGVSELTAQQIADIKASLPANLSVQREQIVLTAYSLVSKVNYFWGGKSSSIGWDSRWGIPTVVTSKGSKSTGQTRPFGLDCSGYVKWVFLNAGYPLSVLDSSFGTGSSTQWTYSVSVTSPLPGDLAFKSIPGTGINHVGIVVGSDSRKNIIVTHCASTPNGVVVTTASPTFKYFRRPIVLFE